jgi:metal transporter CNNM
MLTRALIGYDAAEERPVSQLITQPLPQCPTDLSLVEGKLPRGHTHLDMLTATAMNYFQTGRSHILLVSTSPGRQEGAVGIVTLEDVVEVSMAPGDPRQVVAPRVAAEKATSADFHNRN